MKKNITFSLVLFIVTTLIWAVSLVYLRSNNNSLDEINQKINQKNQEDKYARQIKDILSKNQLSVNQFSSLLPDNSNFQYFVSFLESCATNNTTEIVIDFESDSKNKSTLKNSQAKTGKNYVNLTIELNGSSSNVVKTLEDIEEGMYFVEFSKLNYISRSDDSSLATIKAQGKIYVDKQFKQ